MITVTFDSNVWENVVAPEEIPEDPLAGVYTGLNSAVKAGEIGGCLTMGVFDLEAIPRKARGDALRCYRPKIESSASQDPSSGRIRGRVELMPNPEGHPGNSPQLKAYFQAAVDLGFKILRMRLPGFPMNPDIGTEHYLKCDEDKMEQQRTLYYDVYEYIHGLGCGINVAIKLGRANQTREATWMNALGSVVENNGKKVGRAVAEWADGDSIAAHISYGIDYFCTLDEAKTAGSNSVFSQENRGKLSKRFGLKVLKPDELLQIVTGDSR